MLDYRNHFDIWMMDHADVPAARARRGTSLLRVGAAAAALSFVAGVVVAIIVPGSSSLATHRFAGHIAEGAGHDVLIADATSGSLEFGGAGRSLWAVTTSGDLDLSDDGGASWRVADLPVSLSGLRMPSYAVGSSGTTVWLVTPTSGGDELFRSDDDGQTWAQGVTVPDATTVGTTGPGATSVYVDLVTMVLGFIATDRFVQATHARDTLDISTNGGDSFTQSRLPNFGRVTFENSSDGLLAGGPGDQFVYATSDGGQSWTSIDARPAAAAEWTVGIPVAVSGGSYAIPVTATSTGKSVGTSLSLYLMSWDFDSPSSPAPPAARLAVTSATSWSDPSAVAAPVMLGPVRGTAFASDAGAVLVVQTSSSGQISISRGTSASAAVTPIGTAGLPSGTGWGVTAIVPTGATSIVIGLSNNRCVDKASCTDESALYSTSDDGSSWSQMQP